MAEVDDYLKLNARIPEKHDEWAAFNRTREREREKKSTMREENYRDVFEMRIVFDGGRGGTSTRQVPIIIKCSAYSGFAV